MSDNLAPLHLIAILLRNNDQDGRITQGARFDMTVLDWRKTGLTIEQMEQCINGGVYSAAEAKQYIATA